jgi:hypothetical protein
LVPFSGKSILSWIEYAEGHFGATNEPQEAYADRKKDIGDNQSAAEAVGPYRRARIRLSLRKAYEIRIQHGTPATSAIKQTSRMKGSRSVHGVASEHLQFSLI